MVHPFGEHLCKVSFAEGCLGEPHGRVPLVVGLQVAAAVHTLVDEGQQLHSLCRRERESGGKGGGGGGDWIDDNVQPSDVERNCFMIRTNCQTIYMTTTT